VVLSRITNKMFCASTICMRRTFGRAKHETSAVALESAPSCAAVVLLKDASAPAAMANKNSFALAMTPPPTNCLGSSRFCGRCSAFTTRR
jgi:hypothetical protein